MINLVVFNAHIKSKLKIDEGDCLPYWPFGFGHSKVKKTNMFGMEK